jgi:hypothetical protein
MIAAGGVAAVDGDGLPADEGGVGRHEEGGHGRYLLRPAQPLQGMFLGDRCPRADAVICTPRLEDPDLRRDVLVREHYICLCAKDHPRITDEPTLSAYLGERHLSVDAPSASAEWSLRAANVRIFTLPVDVQEVELSLYTYDLHLRSQALLAGDRLAAVGYLRCPPTALVTRRASPDAKGIRPQPWA